MLPMSSGTDQFWHYAKEALLSASSTKTEDDRQNLLELAQIWTRAPRCWHVSRRLSQHEAASVGGLLREQKYAGPDLIGCRRSSGRIPTPNVYVEAGPKKRLNVWVIVFLFLAATLAGAVCRHAAAHLNKHQSNKHQPRVNHPQSSSQTRLAAGASGFLTLTHVFDRPDSYFDPRFFETMPSHPSAHAFSNTAMPSAP
jgi:hypothetical protein